MNHGAACGNRNMTSTWLLVYKDTWVRGEHYGVCVRPQRTVSEAESGGEVEGVGVMGQPLRADTMNPAGLKHSFCLTSVYEVILSWNLFFFFLQMNLTDFWIRTELRSFYMNYQRKPKASTTLQLMLWQFRLKVFSLFCFIHFALSSSSLRLLLFVSNIKRPRSCDSDSQPCAWICSNFGSTRCFVVCCSADWTFVTSQADPGGCKHDFHLHAGVF